MIITKKPIRKSDHRLSFYWFPRGRDAFEHVLRTKGNRGRRILIPPYIGWGPVEGSGVFDPIARSRAPFTFYRMKGLLEIDFASARRAIEANPNDLGAYQQLAVYMLLSGRPDEVLATYESALEANPDSGVMHLLVGTLQDARGRPAAAGCGGRGGHRWRR